MTIELLDPAGHVLYQTTSDFDGYLLFDTVPYGDYRLQVGAANATAIGVERAIGPTLRIDADHSSQRLGRIRLQALPGAPAMAQGP